MIGYSLIPTLWKYTNGPVQPEEPKVSSGEVSNPARIYGGGSRFGLEVGFLLGGLVVVPFTLWIANVFTHYVDEPSVRIGRLLETTMCLEEQ
jgi:hypothetical protein